MPEFFCGGTIQSFRKIRLSKNFLHKEQISIFSVETLLSHSVEKTRKGAYLCFKKHLASKVFMQRRGHLVLSNIFCFTGSKSFVRVPFCIPKFFRCGQKVMDKRWGCPVFISNFFVSLYRKISWNTVQCFKKLRVLKTFMHKKWISLPSVELF